MLSRAHWIATIMPRALPRNEPVEAVEESWITGFLDVILVPQTRFSDAFSIRGPAEPFFRGRIEQWLIVVAQKSDRVHGEFARRVGLRDQAFDRDAPETDRMIFEGLVKRD
jgi:hypothetical protein